MSGFVYVTGDITGSNVGWNWGMRNGTTTSSGWWTWSQAHTSWVAQCGTCDWEGRVRRRWKWAKRDGLRHQRRAHG